MGSWLIRPRLEDPLGFQLENVRATTLLGYGASLGPIQFGLSVNALPEMYFKFPLLEHFSVDRLGQSACAARAISIQVNSIVSIYEKKKKWYKGKLSEV